MLDCQNIRFFVLFVGSSRSGSTLVRSFLDAHHGAVISNELNVVGRMIDGKPWRETLKAIVANSEAFAKHAKWTDYDYRIPLADDKSGQLEILGDKNAGRSTIYFLEDPNLLDRFLNWAQAPVRFIHCLRHPADVIATKWRKNQKEVNDLFRRRAKMEALVERHFLRDGKAAEIVSAAGANRAFRVYHEQLIEDPRGELTKLCHFLGLTPFSEYLKACESVIYDRPHLSRDELNWAPGTRHLIAKAVEKRPDLRCYLD